MEDLSNQIIPCNICGRMVPAMNMHVHQIHACPGPSNVPPVARMMETSMDVDEEEEDSKMPAEEDRKPAAEDVLDLTRSPTQPPREVVDLIDDSLEDDDDESYVEIMENPPNQQAADDDWSCPRCTLRNPADLPHCQACNFANPNARAPDPVRRERLVQPDSYFASPFGGLAASGAILGGASGAAIGRPFSGAITGALSGALLQELFPSSPTARRPAARATRATAARPRTYIHRTPNSIYMSTTTIGGHPDASPAARLNQIHQQMLAQLRLPVHGARNIDNMNYEQLLAAFGDGTENLGAQSYQIEQLPLATIRDPTQELPEDSRQCMICLEDFKAGDERRTLPCLHGYHKACADKWLRTNGSCPVCKHKIDG